MDEIRAKILGWMTKIRSYGIPSEETVALPVLATVFIVNKVSVGNTYLHVTELGLYIAPVICGFWLGVATTQRYWFKVCLRAFYIGILSAIGFALGNHSGTHEPDYVEAACLVTSTIGVVFYCSWFLGCTIWELTSGYFTSSAQKDIYDRRKQKISYWIDLQKGNADVLAATKADWIASKVIEKMMDPSNIALFVGIIVGVYTFIRYGMNWILQK